MPNRIDDEHAAEVFGCRSAGHLNLNTVDELLGLAVDGKAVRGAVFVFPVVGNHPTLFGQRDTLP